MKLFFWHLLFNSLFATLICKGQQDTAVLNGYLSAINKIKTVSYDLQRIDTFTTGDVWNNKGKCIIEKDTSDQLFGFHFLAYRLDIKERNLYDGHQMFSINDSSRTYSVINKPGEWVLGFPGGQMIVSDLIKLDKNYSSLETYKNNTGDIIRVNYADDTSNGITNHYEIIYLDHLTNLPIKIVKSLISLKKKQVQIEILSDVKVNDPSTRDIDDKDNLRTYAILIPETKHSESLVGNKSSAFTLNSFSGKQISSFDYKGKVILLDFWETWCGPCVMSMPKVEALFRKYSKNGLVILGIMSEEKSLESAKVLVDKRGLTFTDLVGNSDVKLAYHVIAVPKYILINEQGKIIYESSDGYDEKLEQALKEKFNF